MPNRSSLRLRHLVFIALFLAVLSTLIGIPISYGKPNSIFTVTNLNNSGAGSLRWALNQANVTDGPDQIDIQVSGTIKLLWDLPQIAGADEDMVINGPANGVTIDGNSHQVFYVNHRGFTMRNIKITNAYYLGDFGGSAIYNDHGIVNVIDSTFITNKSTAVYSNFGKTTITNSTFDGNMGGQGAALFNDGGTIQITNSVFRNNKSSAGNSSVPFGGGAIYHLGGTMNVNNTTMNNNSAQAGGAMLLKGGTVNLVNTTIAGNTAAASSGGTGGALYIVDGTINLTNVTIASNSAGGGGVYVNFGTTKFINTLVASNLLSGNCVGTIVDGGGNLQFGGSLANSCGATVTTPASDPLGGNTLANNGGPTQTIALPAGSAAIDNASANCPATDQRGFARSAAPCDSGAYEHNAKGNTTTTITSDNPDPSTTGQAVTISFIVADTTLRQPNSARAPRQSGSVTVASSDGLSCLGALIDQGNGTSTGSCIITFLSVGAKTLTASYPGDANFNASSTTVATPHQVNAAVGGVSVPKEVPEADTLLLLGGGISGLGVWLRWQWSKRKRAK